MTRLQWILVGGSLAVHLGGFVWMGILPKEKKTDSVAIALAEAKKKDPPKKEQPPPPPPKDLPKTQAKAAKAAPPVEPKLPDAPPPPPSTNAASDAPAGMDGFENLGLSLGGGSGGGMAVPAGGGHRAAGPAPTTTATTRTVRALAPAAADECTEEVVKAKLDHQVQPAYSQEARAGNVEGVVKLEVTLDAAGHVVSVRVLKGLGFGLDEAAISAAKQWTFLPATRCGKPVSSVIKPGVRFQLGS